MSKPYNITDTTLHPPSRHALLHIPSAYTPETRMPIIIALHGKDQPASEFEQHTQLSNPSLNNEYIIAYPSGMNKQWTGDPASPSRSEVDDIAFINVLLDHLIKDYNIDTSRIYVVGFSNGGGLTGLLAGDHRASSRIAAFAMSSGAFYTDPALKEPLFGHADLARKPIPILEFHGDVDPVIHYDGKSTPDGVTYQLMEFFEMWVERNGMKEAVVVREELFEGKVERFSWRHEGEEALVHYKIQGFGHGWPTTGRLSNDDQRFGPTFFDATPLVLEWFGRFKLAT